MRKGLWKRLDIRLSSILFGIIFAWFGTFLLSLHWVQKERVGRSVEIERERIAARVDSEMRIILGSIVLKHEEALQITLQGLVRDLGLSSIELSLKGGKALHYTGPDSMDDGQPIREEFPVRQQAREFGRLRIEKTIALLPYASGHIGYWVIALLVIQGVLFWIIRRFLRSQVINPIREVISNSVSASGVKRAPAAHAEEIEDLNRLFVNMKEENDRYHEKLIESERRAVLGKIASQVSHDIRSPLSALEELLRSITKLPEQERVLARRAINRIRDIAHLLLSKSKENLLQTAPPGPEKKVELLPSVVEAIVAEKRVQHQSKVNIEIESTIDPSAYGAFAAVDSKDLQRMLSNLVDNAVDALTDKGRIVVSVSRPTDAGVEISVSDDGKGMPPEILHKLQSGIQVSHGKENGHGLGFAFVKEKTTEWNDVN